MGKSEKKSVCAFGTAYFLGQLESLEKNLEAARSAKDIEPVHQLRVTARRLRTGIKHFRACLPDKKTRAFEDEIRRLGSALGKARDLDTQIETLNTLYDDKLNQKFKPGYRRLLLRLKQRRMKRQKKIEQSLDEIQGKKVFTKIKTHLEESVVDADQIYLFTPSLYQRAFDAINTDLEAFLSFERFVRSPEDMEKLHAMRIAGKHLRYSMEIFSPIFKDALVPHIQYMKDIQNQLGRMHDDDVWVSWLPKFLQEEETRVNDYFGNTGPLKRLIPGIEHLVEDRQASREKAYRSFLSTWEALGREKAWDNLRGIIRAPLKIETAMRHLAEIENKNSTEEIQTPIPEKVPDRTPAGIKPEDTAEQPPTESNNA